MQHDHSGSDNTDRQRRVSQWVFIGFVLIAAYFLITEHRAHLVAFVPYLPFLLVAACPLLHFFHHRGHGDGGASSPPSGSDALKDSVSGEHRH
jgi:hypothetical protein